MTFTLVSFHAHPDDEALLTGGTLARVAAEGHRVVLVVATRGEAGLAASSYGPPEALAEQRVAELHRSATVLGCARVELLGYADSGMRGEHLGAPGAFAAADPAAVAGRLADLLRDERADVLTSYDARGGYGHPDHVQVHRAGRLAAAQAGARLLEATVDRRRLQRGLRLARLLGRTPAGFDPGLFDSAYAEPDEITHRVDVRPYLAAKRAAMAAHASQGTAADAADRTLAFLLRLPAPLFRLAAGREWFVDPGGAPAHRPVDDVFATLREPPS